MAPLVLLLIILAGLDLCASDLNSDFQNFLKSPVNSKSYQENSDTVAKLYQLYNNDFKRSTTTAAEEKTRFQAFNDTLNNLLKTFSGKSQTYTVGLNNYSDWTPEELKNLGGARVPQGAISITNAKSSQRLLTVDGNVLEGKSTVLPASFDYTQRVITGTNTPVVTPIKNQGICGSCWAFAFVSLLENQYAFQLKSSANLSEQQMVDCSKSDAGCNGGYITNTFKYLQSNSWQVNGETFYPYVTKASSCAFKASGGGGVKFGSLVYKMVGPNNATAMQEALINYGPLWGTLFVGDSTAHYSILASIYGYKSGIWTPPITCPSSISTINHAVVIVGYGVDSATGIPFWKVRNSWGTYWGEQGYFRIRRGVNMCGIEAQPYLVAKAA
jgi:C1A family cysteine protease